MTGAVAARPIKVLLVEDNPGDAQRIFQMLREVSDEFDLQHVDRLEAALEKLGRAAVDIVLLDLGLPDSQGLATFERARQRAAGEPIVVISDSEDEQIALEAVRAGAQDYLVKGRIPGRGLARVIRHAIERQRTQARLDAIVRSALDAHVMMDAAGTISGWNPQAETVFGWAAAEVLGRPLAEIIVPPAMRERHLKGLRHFLATGAGPILNQRVELTAVRKNGQEFPVELTVTPVRVAEEWSFSAFLRDISERRRSEDALRLSEERYRLLFESTPAPMWVYDLESLRILAANSAAAAQYGYSHAELLTMSIEQLRPAEDVPKLRELIAAGMPPGFHRSGSWRHVTKDGTNITVEMSSHEVSFEGRRARLVVANDVTARVRAERVQSAVYRIAEATQTAAGLPELLRAIHDIVGTLMPAKSFYIALYDEATDLITFPYFVDEVDAQPPAPRHPGRGITEYVLRTGLPLLAKPESKLEMDYGGSVEAIGAPSVDWLGVPLMQGERAIGVLAVQSYTAGVRYEERDKEILHFVSIQVATAIERKRSEEALAERTRVAELAAEIGAALTRGTTLVEILKGCCEALVRNLDAAFARIWTLNEPQQVLELQASAGLYTHLDGPHSRVAVGQYKIGLIASERLPHVTNTVIGDPRVGDQEWAKREGMVAFAGYPLLVQDRVVGVVAMFARHPFTEFVSEALATAADSIAVAIERKHAEEALQESELRARTLFETVNLIVVGLHASGTIEYVNPYFLELTGFTPEELIGASWFDRCLPKGQQAAVHDAFLQLLERNAHTHFQNAIVTKDGAERMVAWSNTVIRDASGKATATLSIGEDVTDRTALEVQLRQAQKMEAVGRLAGGVAHDFNNLLTAIFGYSDLLGEELPVDSPAREDLKEIRTAATRAAALTRQLLAFSRQQVLQPVVLNMNDVLANLESMLQRVLGEDVELDTHKARDLGNVKADPGQLEQVIMNLAVNARDAMPTGGKLTLETSNVALSGEYAAAHRPVAPGDYIMLAVSDSGIGMDETVKTRLFEPFFTTKAVGAGTGLGLATVYGIVKQSGGYIWVYSEPGHGATFKVYLPRVQAPVEEVKQAPLPAVNLGGTETILLAEDEELLRPLARELLVRLGYRVIEATNAAEALDLARAHPEEIHLLVSDVVMPGQSGLQLARQLATERPDMKVLYMSGYTDEAIVRHGLLDPGTNFLQKPFTPNVLARKVREVLDAPPK